MKRIITILAILVAMSALCITDCPACGKLCSHTEDCIVHATEINYLP